MATDPQVEISRRILAGYERMPQGVPDERGDPEQWSVVHARELHRRLDAEERAAGCEPW